MLKNLKHSEIKDLKEKLWLKNGKKCPLLGIEIPLDKMVLDHIHKLKSEEPSEQKGTIRNALEFKSNSLEGKISNAWKRYFGRDESKYPCTLSNFLRNLADYLERGSYCDEGVYYVHPTEISKSPILSKKQYNKLKKAYIKSCKKAKFPEYPKSRRLTKPLKKLFEEFHIAPYLR